MLRGTFLYLSKQSWLRHWMENSSVSHRLTSRFIAGRSLSEGIHVLKNLWAERTFATLDFLGENVTSLEDAVLSRDSYVAAMCEIQRAHLPATVSIKLTQFGLDFSAEACRNNVIALIERAQDMDSR